MWNLNKQTNKKFRDRKQTGGCRVGQRAGLEEKMGENGQQVQTSTYKLVNAGNVI